MLLLDLSVTYHSEGFGSGGKAVVDFGLGVVVLGGDTVEELYTLEVAVDLNVVTGSVVVVVVAVVELETTVSFVLLERICVSSAALHEMHARNKITAVEIVVFIFVVNFYSKFNAKLYGSVATLKTVYYTIPNQQPLEQ